MEQFGYQILRYRKFRMHRTVTYTVARERRPMAHLSLADARPCSNIAH